MDIYCPICGEPYDMDEFHDVEGMTFTQATRNFDATGCAVLADGIRPSYCKADRGPQGVFGLSAAEASGALFDLLGDDIDGIAAMMEDLNF